MRLRRRPGTLEVLETLDDFVYSRVSNMAGQWREIFGNSHPIYVELGTGKGRFISEMAVLYPDRNFIGIEKQPEVIYQAAKKVKEKNVANIKLVLADVNFLAELFCQGEVDGFFINFCDPWPKVRHAKRRLTSCDFLEKYQKILMPKGEICFKTDNEQLFEFSLNQFSEQGMKLSNITLDLHHRGVINNVMTEYEEKFSSQGMKIYYCQAGFR